MDRRQLIRWLAEDACNSVLIPIMFGALALTLYGFGG